ncbi:MAG: ORF6N domain-containing protein [Planctomycetaceae bacterium]|nr:ORF6N domain-containing protein [Planctomycetaceae bacterium]
MCNLIVIFDNDLTKLYSIETRCIHEAVKNNSKKFPEGYIFDLEQSEWDFLRSKILTANLGGRNKLSQAFSQESLYSRRWY